MQVCIFFLKLGFPLDIPWGLYSGNFTRRDHPGNLRRVSGSGPVRWHMPSSN